MGSKQTKDATPKLRFPELKDESGEVLKPLVLSTPDDPATHVQLTCFNSDEYDAVLKRLSYITKENFEQNGFAQLGSVICSLNHHIKPDHLAGLMAFVNDVMGEEERQAFFDVVVKMAEFAPKLKELFPKKLPMLVENVPSSVTLSREQVACLLVHGFFGAIAPLQTTSVPVFNFAAIYRIKSLPFMHAKIRMLLHYFRTVMAKVPKGSITYERRVLSKADKEADFYASEEKLGGLTIETKSLIEDATGAIQADFANKAVGGGVFGAGRLQEEIRFVVSPELLIATLMSYVMHLHEVVIISGSLQYCSYTGYSDGLTYAGDPKTKLSHQAKKGGDVVLAIDACFFQSYPVQFKEDFIKREFFKLHAGLMPLDSEADGNRLKFATGAWGCGAFGGIPQVKAIIQLILSSYHKRDLLYYHVGAERRISPQSLANLHTLLVDNDIRVGKLASWLKSYEKKGWDRVDLFSFIANQVLKDKEKLASFQLENEIGSVAKMLGTKDDGEDDESSDT